MTAHSEEVKRDHFGPPRATAEEAMKAGLNGWNLRCNRCGDYGATWIVGARPNWGSLALCYPEKKEYEDMLRRHADEMASFTDVQFEQDR